MHCFKDTHITAPISLAKTCYKVTPITRDLESSVTPKAWEKWGYLIDNDHGSHHLPFFSTRYSLSLLTCRIYSILPSLNTSSNCSLQPAWKAESWVVWGFFIGGMCVMVSVSGLNGIPFGLKTTCSAAQLISIRQRTLPGKNETQ